MFVERLFYLVTILFQLYLLEIMATDLSFIYACFTNW